MRFILGIGATTNAADKVVIAPTVHTCDKHIHIVMTIISSKTFFINLRKCNFTDGFPIVLDIRSRAVRVGTGFADPMLDIILSPVAGRKKNVTAAVFQGKTHAFVQKFTGHLARFQKIIVF